jgi:hypothetical protein
MGLLNTNVNILYILYIIYLIICNIKILSFEGGVMQGRRRERGNGWWVKTYNAPLRLTFQAREGECGGVMGED